MSYFRTRRTQGNERYIYRTGVECLGRSVEFGIPLSEVQDLPKKALERLKAGGQSLVKAFKGRGLLPSWEFPRRPQVKRDNEKKAPAKKEA